MRKVRISQPRPDCLSIEVGGDLRRVLAWLLAPLAFAAALLLVEEGTAASLALLTLGALTLPALGVRLLRLARTREHSLVRTPGRLLLDGDPLEMARVELRVRQMPITRVPTGYDLSLWVMTLSGPDDVPLGSYRTLLDASRVSGLLEDFVQRANVKQPRHV